MPKIANAVGQKGAINRPVDVMIVQHLLNANHSQAGIQTPLKVNGEIDAVTQAAIIEFQKSAIGLKIQDGRVDPGGKTFLTLCHPHKTKDNLSLLRPVLRCSPGAAVARPGDSSSDIGIINAAVFTRLYSKQLGQLGTNALAGLTALVGYINDDMEILDVGWAAYMLATVKHECANKWQPIREFGLGAGKAYGNPVSVKDAQGKTHTNTYYGRGYVQLTHKANYDQSGKDLGLGDALVIDPDKALDPETSYKIMSNGMRKGLFTTRMLSHYINATKCDYLQARRIINGIDQYTLIAGYAENLELLLRVSCNTSISSSAF